MEIAVIMTVFNRCESTLRSLDSVEESLKHCGKVAIHAYITDDGSTDSTSEMVSQRGYSFPITFIEGTGNLFWNGGMNAAWKAAIDDGGYDGYLWLNNDTEVFPDLWNEIIRTDSYSVSNFGKHGVYVGSTMDPVTGAFTYGGFDFTNKITLKDRFKIPDGSVQQCQCGHGNVTFISAEVVKQLGILPTDYIHGGGDHDYTYNAHRKGFPVLVPGSYVGKCVNDHEDDGYAEFFSMPLKKRLAYLKSPVGFNLHNTIVFQKRFFPYRLPFVVMTAYMKTLFPKTYMGIYKLLRK